MALTLLFSFSLHAYVVIGEDPNGPTVEKNSNRVKYSNGKFVIVPTNTRSSKIEVFGNDYLNVYYNDTVVEVTVFLFDGKGDVYADFYRTYFNTELYIKPDE